MTDLERRRDLLVARCAAQRDELEALTQRVERPLAVADRGVAVVRYFRERPLAIGALTAVLVATRGRGLARWTKLGLTAWRAYRALAAARKVSA